MAWWEGAKETRVLIAQGNTTSYLYSNGVLLELQWFKQCFGSWFLGDYVCEDGRLYTATPIDPVFILLPVFDEARMKKGNEPGKFRQLDEIIYVDGYPGYQTLSQISDKTMEVVCDITEIGSTKFFRLNDEKVLKWLCYKVNQLKRILPTLDNNFAAQDEKNQLFDAVSIIREYLKDEPWENNAMNKKVAPTTRQAKKVKMEKDSHNIKDMFSRATRKRG
ncbi:hypothetical protein MIMGU_mgv1a013487mg [Erythranthe guttata]|uniref:Ribonuclease H2 subunit B n=1 Tax=Erythranthe guttata TaxID=4155 RepID=A0A022Q425_ERYGU|nr:hypothetical protein MIMGU_mgv1a013487mg [Erythranthe guttata]